MALLVLVLEILGVIDEILKGFDVSTFQFYTSLSNYFTLVVCLLYVSYPLRNKPIPSWLHLLQFMATVCLTVTFLVVVLVFGSMMGSFASIGFFLWDHDWKYRHFLCPLLLFVDNLMLEEKNTLPKNAVWIAVIPTLVYAVVSVCMNVLRLWDGPYPFLHVYEQPVLVSVMWFGVINLGAFLVAILLKKLRGIAHKS